MCIAHQKATEYIAKSKKKRIAVRIPDMNPFLAPSLVADFNFSSYLWLSFSSPPNAKTVLMEEMTSSAMAPAPAYFFCSRLVNFAVTYKATFRSMLLSLSLSLSLSSALSHE